MTETTTVEIHDTTWDRLNARKARGESFDTVITRLLDRDRGAH